MGEAAVMARAIGQAAQELREACDGLRAEPGGWVSLAATELADRLAEERARITRLAAELEGVAEQLARGWHL
jgi:hypothetical protein